MKTTPLPSISIEEAKQFQFKLIDEITRVFTGLEVLSLGDVGVVANLNQPQTTAKVEQVIANFFNVEAATLVQGAGTGALRNAFSSIELTSRNVLVHKAPIYPTTEVTFKLMNLHPIYADFHDADEVIRTVSEYKIDFALIQTTRQKLDDYYDLKGIVDLCNSLSLTTVVDDNYAVMKIPFIGAQLGATVSAFSSFKLLGPEGIGIVCGKKENIKKIRDMNYSGGGQVQGATAMEVLRGLIYAPVSLAIQAEVIEHVASRLNQKEVNGILNAYIVNAQSKVLIVEFEKEVAEKVLAVAEQLGAAPHPVGAESKYEFAPMFYRVSGTFLKADPTLKYRMIRINPMRSGSDTIIRILKQSLETVTKEGM